MTHSHWSVTVHCLSLIGWNCVIQTLHWVCKTTSNNNIHLLPNTCNSTLVVLNNISEFNIMAFIILRNYYHPVAEIKEFINASRSILSLRELTSHFFIRIIKTKTVCSLLLLLDSDLFLADLWSHWSHLWCEDGVGPLLQDARKNFYVLSVELITSTENRSFD